MQRVIKKYRLKDAFSSRPSTPIREDEVFFPEQKNQDVMDLDEMTQLEDQFQQLNLKRKRDLGDAISPMEDGENHLENMAPAAKKACTKSISMCFGDFGGLKDLPKESTPFIQEAFFSKPTKRFTLIKGKNTTAQAMDVELKTSSSSFSFGNRSCKQ